MEWPRPPSLVCVLLSLSEQDIEKLDKNVLLNLTCDQLRDIYTSKIVNFPLIARINNEERLRYKEQCGY